MGEKCYLCGKGRLTSQLVDYALYGIHLGKFQAEACNKCNERFYTEAASKTMTEIAKKKGLWGLQARTKLGWAGTTLDIRLPKKIISFMGLKQGKEVDIYPEGKNRLVVEVQG
ncbi:AbrB/MazE/SpoVT family DNA-binding domain-containing protein [Candidatus Woesearchaeota archaeon]|nr:AbrB/MazE/SpoVT family DNA-binding domain-containing protein [Candidatus Woesearchaeota archaeon]